MTKDKKKIPAKYLFVKRNLQCENSRFEVFFDHLILDNSNQIKDFLTIKPKVILKNKIVGVCVLPIIGDKFCLMNGWRHQFNSYVYQAPAGFCEKGEKPYETALRELFEETSLICKQNDLISLGYYLPDAGLIEGKVALFLATNCLEREKSRLDNEVGIGEKLLLTKQELLKIIFKAENIGGSTLVASFRGLNYLDQNYLSIQDF